MTERAFTTTYRIGIDVGGTFTDAVALDDATHELVAQVKVPTTHAAAEGVALGITQALARLLSEAGIAPEQVRFIAHGTTQATNALLEGDVAKVGIVATGQGLEGKRARTETAIPDIELAPGKLLRTVHAFTTPDGIGETIEQMKAEGAGVIVAAGAFSVDDPSAELAIIEAAEARGLAATGTHEISKLYGLRIRTLTAVINGSILPRMVETAAMTANAVEGSGIAAPLMIMRGDGGVMTIDAVRRRPILTLLSGPAAGVAGALLYEKMSNGLFLEVGGTSTDISAVKNGQVQVGYAEVGGHKTYVTSLDVKTVGVAGGSMVRLTGNRIEEVGPRSAHIAGLDYAAYADPDQIVDPRLELFAPLPGDPTDYVAIRCANGRRFALTPACAANLLGYAPAGAYAYADPEAARRAFAPLAERLNVSIEEAARELLAAACRKLAPIVGAQAREHGLDPANVLLLGGGGGCAAIVPFLAETLGVPWKLANNHQVISPIGVALALVRESVERTIVNPTEADLAGLRAEAEAAARRSGAADGTIEVRIEIDAPRNLARAVATGATELRTGDRVRTELAEPELAALAAASMNVDQAELAGSAGRWRVYTGTVREKALFGLARRSRRLVRVLDTEGVIKLQETDANIAATTIDNLPATVEECIRADTVYGDAGGALPRVFVLWGERLVDLSSLQTGAQMLGMLAGETLGAPPDAAALVLSVRQR